MSGSSDHHDTTQAQEGPFAAVRMWMSSAKSGLGGRSAQRVVICLGLLILAISGQAVPGQAVAPSHTAQTQRATKGVGASVTGNAAESGQAVLDDKSLEDVDLLELEVPTVVTATRREQKITTVPHAVSVITKEDIRRSGARSIPDALRLAPGVDVAQLSYGNAAVSPRGFHGFVSRQVLVLVDGRQIFDSLFGGTVWGSWPFQLEDIERIEVIRGPAGVAWGPNAVNGVINIITKDPADQSGLTAGVGTGSRGLHKEHLGYAFRDGKLRMRVSGEFEGSDGFRDGGSILRNLDDGYQGGRVGAHAIHDLGPKDTLTISAGTALVNELFPPTPVAGLGLERDSESHASYLLAKLNHEFEKGNVVELTGYVNDFFGSPGVPAIDYRYQQVALQLSHTFRPAEGHTLTWGIDNRVDLLDATNSDPYALSKGFVATDIIGLYVEDAWRFAPKWALSLGGRVDYEFYGGFQPSARAALSYELTDSSFVYGAVSRAFQMPSAGLRFLNIPMLNGLAHVTGERDAGVETLIAYELGYRGKFFDRVESNLNLFWHEFSDLTTISPTLGPPGLMRMDFEDRADASMFGVELDARYAVTDRLTLLGNYTFQELDWRSGARYHEKDTISPPSHKFMLGARYTLTDDLHLSTHLYYVDTVTAPNPANPFFPRHIDPYFRLDLRAEYEFWKDQASVALGVRNLLDSGHYEGGTMFLNDAEVPRMFYVELRMAVK